MPSTSKRRDARRSELETILGVSQFGFSIRRASNRSAVFTSAIRALSGAQ